MCVQRFDDSLNSAIHITYRISLRSSSMLEPRDPLLKVFIIGIDSDITDKQILMGLRRAPGHISHGFMTNLRKTYPGIRQSNKGKLTMGEELGAETPGSAKPLSR